MQVAQNHRGGARVRLHSLQADAQHNGDHRCTVDSAQRRRSTVHSDGVRTMQTLTSSDQHIVIAQLIAMRTSTICVPGGGDVRLQRRSFNVRLQRRAFPREFTLLLEKMNLSRGRADLEDGLEGLREDGADALEAG